MYRGDVIRHLTNINNRLCRELKLRSACVANCYAPKPSYAVARPHPDRARAREHRIVMRRTQMFDSAATSTYRSFIAVHSAHRHRREIEALGTAVQILQNRMT
jgi:hypothetical protein